VNIEKKQSEMETFFLALADKTRLRLLNLMREGEICVCFLVEVLNESQPKISRHLAYMRSAGIVEARRDGKWMHYRIITPKDDFAAQLLQNTLTWMSSQKKMQTEYEKLREICFFSNNTITLTYAPIPNIFAKTNMSKKQNRELDTFLL
jgi:ArsR family transcriptional regulator